MSFRSLKLFPSNCNVNIGFSSVIFEIRAAIGLRKSPRSVLPKPPIHFLFDFSGMTCGRRSNCAIPSPFLKVQVVGTIIATIISPIESEPIIRVISLIFKLLLPNINPLIFGGIAPIRPVFNI